MSRRRKKVAREAGTPGAAGVPRPGGRWLPALVLAGVAVIGAAAWWTWLASPAFPRAGDLRGANLLLITIDTLRTDRVGAYGAGPLTPTLDGLAATGVRFTRAYAHAPMTLPSHASILTGLTPPGHGVRNNGTFRLDDGIETLATLLDASGYRTGAFVGAFVLDRRFGLSRGFDVYDDRYGQDQGPLTFGFVERRAEQVLEPAARWILEPATDRAGDGSSTSPWFAWVHLFDPHAPYDAPERLAASPYDGEVAYVDRRLGEFVSRLEGAGALDHTLVVVTADHGESLGDHGEETHGLFAYDVTLRVPLIVSGPDIPAAVRDDPVSHADLLPTVTGLLGIAPPARLDGRSLLPRLSGEEDVERPVYIEALDANLTRNWAPLTGLVEDGWKYIELPVPELYALDRDPAEERNLAGQEPERARAMALRLRDLGPRLARGAPSGERTPLDAEAMARLQSLGYLAAGGSAPAEGGYAERDDPKNLVALNGQFFEALTLTGEGELERALALLRSVVEARPDFTAAYTAAASVLIESGRPADAVSLLSGAPEVNRRSPDFLRHLGSAWLAAGRPDQTIAVLEPLAAAGQASVDARNTLGVAYSQAGRIDEARRTFSDVLEVAPNAAGTWNNLGIAEMSAGRRDAAAAAFRRAVEADPGYGPAWQGLGHAIMESDREGAIAAWIEATRLTPGDYDTLFNLGVVMAGSARRADARPYLERFVRDAPVPPYAEDVAFVKDLLARLP